MSQASSPENRTPRMSAAAAPWPSRTRNPSALKANGRGRLPSSARTMFSAAVLPCRSACCAVGGQALPPRSGSGTRAQSPSAQTLPAPRTCRLPSTSTAPVVPRSNGSLASSGAGRLPAAQTSVRVGSWLPFERDGLGGGARDPGVEQEVHAAALELAERVVAELGTGLREDAVAAVHQHEAGLGSGDGREESPDAVHQVAEPGHHLDAGEPAPGDHEGELAAALGGGGLHVSLLEPGDHVVAEPGRVGEGLE